MLRSLGRKMRDSDGRLQWLQVATRHRQGCVLPGANLDTTVEGTDGFLQQLLMQDEPGQRHQLLLVAPGPEHRVKAVEAMFRRVGRRGVAILLQ